MFIVPEISLYICNVISFVQILFSRYILVPYTMKNEAFLGRGATALWGVGTAMAAVVAVAGVWWRYGEFPTQTDAYGCQRNRTTR